MTGWRMACRGLAAAWIALTAGACVTRAQYDRQRNAAKHWEEIATNMEANQHQLESENRALQGRVAELELKTVSSEHASGLRDAREAYERRLKELEATLGGIRGIEHGDIEVLSGPEGPIVRITDALLFDSGSDEVKSSATSILATVAGEVASKSPKAVRVEGHTDNDPVVKTKARWPHGNLQLSSARALQIALSLRKAGIAEEKISIAGFGEWRPIAPNTSPEGKRRNRRVEIAIVE